MSIRPKHSPDETTDTFPQQTKLLKTEQHILINERPCKITQVKISKQGKHGYTKIFMEAVDIFNCQKHSECFPHSIESVSMAKVSVKDYELIDIDDDGYIELVDEKGDSFEDEIQLFGEESQKLSSLFKNSLISKSTIFVKIQSSMDMHKVISFVEKK